MAVNAEYVSWTLCCGKPFNILLAHIFFILLVRLLFKLVRQNGKLVDQKSQLVGFLTN